MRADVTQDTAVFLPLEEPRRTARRTQTVRAEADDLDHPADGALFDELAGVHGTFHMQALAVIHHVFLSGFGGFFLCAVQLFQRGERRLIGKVILAGVHHPQAERTALGGDRRTRDQPHRRVFQNLRLTAGGTGAGMFLEKGVHLGGVGIVHPFKGAAGLGQAVAHAMNVAVVKRRSGKYEFSGFYHRSGFPFGGIGHAICVGHCMFLPLLRVQ